MKVIVAGELPLVEEITALSAAAGHDTDAYLVGDFMSAVERGYLFDQTSEVEVAIELHNESTAAKQELLMALADSIPYGALILTSALATSVTQAASWVVKPARVVGCGLVSPVQAGGLVEVAAALQTSPESMTRASGFWKSLGLEPLVVADGAGLVRARVVCGMINEAVSALAESAATAEEIDRLLKSNASLPYGPLEWADLIGLDTVYGVLIGLFDKRGENRYRPSPLLRRMIHAGRLGRKSRHGFYRYEEAAE